MPSSHGLGEFGVAIVGAGPAGIGPLLQAARQGRFNELLAMGVLVVDASDGAWGAGNIGSYLIPANSEAAAHSCLAGAQPHLRAPSASLDELGGGGFHQLHSGSR